MIRAEFYRDRRMLSGFKVSGHANYADAGYDVVCAAVSSAVQLIINLFDRLEFSPVVKVGENIVECTFEDLCEEISDMLEELENHFMAIAEEFPKNIKITISEV